MPQPIGDDRHFVIETWRTLYGVNPDQWTLDHVVEALQNGSYTRERWAREVQGQNSEAIVQRIFKEVVGADRPANDPGIQFYAERLRSGNMTAQQVKDEMAASSSVQLRNANGPEFKPSQGQEAARDIVNGQLKQLGLESLSGWAWEQIQAGNSTERVMQDLRQRPEYAARFPGMAARRTGNLVAISEGVYLANEREYRQAAQRMGLPSIFWDDPSDYAALIGGDVSPTEYQQRLEEGWAKVQSVPAVRQVFKEWFGVEGDTALASWFIDAGKSTKAILKAADTARTAGFGSIFGMNINQNRANQIYDYGKSSDQAIQAFGRIAQMSPLFSESVSEAQDFTAEGEGLDATLGLNATAGNVLERRGRSRVAATSGGGGAQIGQRGIGGGTAE